MLQDPLLFWSGLEAIATAVAALAAIIAAAFVIPEWRRSRREDVSHKVEGYRIASDLLSSDEFVVAARTLQENPGPAATPQWFDKYPPLLYEILRTMQIIQFLIQQDYLDEDLLFRLYGFRLSSLARLVLAIEESKQSPRIEYWSRLYPGGQELLERSKKWRASQEKLEFLRDPGNPAETW
jgi:hypothetical protein